MTKAKPIKYITSEFIEKKNILFIYEENPASIDYYLFGSTEIPNMIIEWMEKVNGMMVNIDEFSDEEDMVSTFLQIAMGAISDYKIYYPDLEFPKECENVLPKFKLESPKVLANKGQNIDQVFTFSFQL